MKAPRNCKYALICCGSEEITSRHRTINAAAEKLQSKHTDDSFLGVWNGSEYVTEYTCEKDSEMEYEVYKANLKFSEEIDCIRSDYNYFG